MQFHWSGWSGPRFHNKNESSNFSFFCNTSPFGGFKKGSKNVWNPAAFSMLMQIIAFPDCMMQQVYLIAEFWVDGWESKVLLSANKTSNVSKMLILKCLINPFFYITPCWQNIPNSARGFFFHLISWTGRRFVLPQSSWMLLNNLFFSYNIPDEFLAFRAKWTQGLTALVTLCTKCFCNCFSLAHQKKGGYYKTTRICPNINKVPRQNCHCFI